MKRRFFLMLPVLARAVRAQEQPQQQPQEQAQVLEGHLSDRELFDALDLSRPELAAVRAALPNAGDDYSLATAALGKYLRARDIATWWFDARQIDKKIEYSKGGAEDGAVGRVMVVTLRHEFSQGRINWNFNLTTSRDDLPDNNEWQWQLNRMHWWGDIGRAYWATGDEKFARAWVGQLRSWAEQNSAPTRAMNMAPSSWRTIESGIRMSGGWPEAFHRFLLSPSFSDRDIALFLKLCVEHARYLEKFPSTGNWLTMEMAGLYSVATVFPELKQSDGWRRTATNALHRELSTQFLPDGAQVELTPGYHQVALGNILHIPKLAKKTGRMNELPGDFVSRMESVYNFNLMLMTPDGNWPRFNDSWPVNARNSLKDAAELFPMRTDFAWAASNGAQGAPPKATSHPFAYAGYFVMRSGWDKDANYFVLDAGPLGYGHVHQDKLNVVLWSYGREILFDGGGGSYEKSLYRTFATDTPGHNTVLVDGLPQRRQTKNREANVSKKPIEAGWATTSTWDFARGVYEDGYGKEDARIATHTRRVLFAKPDLFIVVDTLAPRDELEHSYQARWHLLPTQIKLDQASGIVTTAEQGKSNLAIVPLLRDGLEVKTASAQLEPELLGWHVRKDMDPQYVPATTVLHSQRGVGVQHFVTLLVPIRAGQAYPIEKAVLEPMPGGERIEVTWRGGRRTGVDVPGDATVALKLK